jgi:hypothetical protein
LRRCTRRNTWGRAHAFLSSVPPAAARAEFSQRENFHPSGAVRHTISCVRWDYVVHKQWHRIFTQAEKNLRESAGSADEFALVC